MPTSFRIQVSVPVSTRIPVWSIARIRVSPNVRISKQIDGYCTRAPLVIIALISEAGALAMTDQGLPILSIILSWALLNEILIRRSLYDLLRYSHVHHHRVSGYGMCRCRSENLE